MARLAPRSRGGAPVCVRSRARDLRQLRAHGGIPLPARAPPGGFRLGDRHLLAAGDRAWRRYADRGDVGDERVPPGVRLEHHRRRWAPDGARGSRRGSHRFRRARHEDPPGFWRGRRAAVGGRAGVCPDATGLDGRLGAGSAHRGYREPGAARQGHRHANARSVLRRQRHSGLAPAAEPRLADRRRRDADLTQRHPDRLRQRAAHQELSRRRRVQRRHGAI